VKGDSLVSSMVWVVVWLVAWYMDIGGVKGQSRQYVFLSRDI